MLGITVMGIVAYRVLPVSDLPNVDFPTLNVGAGLPGGDPGTMASAVASPLERQFTTIAGIDSMTSTSALGVTNITLQFTLSRNIDAATGTIQLKATFANSDSALWPGQFVDVALTLTTEQAVVVPAQAVQPGQQGPFVFVVKPDSTVESRPVKVGRRLARELVIEQGLKGGERVVTDGQLRLLPGSRVEVKPQKPS